jgi:hypothetical protein
VVVAAGQIMIAAPRLRASDATLGANGD